MQATEKQPKVLALDTPEIQDKVLPKPNFAMLQMKHRDDTSSRKTIQDLSRKIPIYPDPVYQSPPKSVKTYIPEIPGSLSDIDPKLNTNFEENSSFQEV